MGLEGGLRFQSLFQPLFQPLSASFSASFSVFFQYLYKSLLPHNVACSAPPRHTLHVTHCTPHIACHILQPILVHTSIVSCAQLLSDGQCSGCSAGLDVRGAIAQPPNHPWCVAVYTWYPHRTTPHTTHPSSLPTPTKHPSPHTSPLNTTGLQPDTLIDIALSDDLLACVDPLDPCSVALLDPSSGRPCLPAVTHSAPVTRLLLLGQGPVAERVLVLLDARQQLWLRRCGGARAHRLATCVGHVVAHDHESMLAAVDTTRLVRVQGKYVGVGVSACENRWCGCIQLLRGLTLSC